MGYYPDPEDKAASYAERIDELEAELHDLRTLRDLIADFVPVHKGNGMVAARIRTLLAGMQPMAEPPNPDPVQITATVEVPITVNWSHNGIAEDEETATAVATVTRVVNDPENWTAVGNWAAGQDTAAITIGGSESGSGGGS